MMPRCPHCQSFAFLDWTACGSCGVELGYRYTTLSFLQVHPEGTVADGDTWRTCSNRDWGCNWLVADSEESGRCFSCRLSRRLPDRDDTIAWETVSYTHLDVYKRQLFTLIAEHRYLHEGPLWGQFLKGSVRHPPRPFLDQDQEPCSCDLHHAP